MGDFVAPHRSFVYFVLYFVNERIAYTEVDDAIRGYGTYILRKMQETCLRGEPKRSGADPAGKPNPLCSVAHVTAFCSRTMRSADVHISMPDGSECKMFVDPWVPCAQVLKQVLEKLGFK